MPARRHCCGGNAGDDYRDRVRRESIRTSRRTSPSSASPASTPTSITTGRCAGSSSRRRVSRPSMRGCHRRSSCERRASRAPSSSRSGSDTVSACHRTAESATARARCGTLRHPGRRGPVRRVRRADAGETAAADPRARCGACSPTQPARACSSPGPPPATTTSPADIAGLGLGERGDRNRLPRRRRDVHRPPRGVRRVAQSALADRARDLRAVAARAGRRAAPTIIDRSRAHRGRAVARSADLDGRAPLALPSRTPCRRRSQSPIDILDEDHSLRLAMRRLATDPALPRPSRRAAREYWEREHSLPAWSTTTGG